MIKRATFQRSLGSVSVGPCWSQWVALEIPKNIVTNWDPRTLESIEAQKTGEIWWNISDLLYLSVPHFLKHWFSLAPDTPSGSGWPGFPNQLPLYASERYPTGHPSGRATILSSMYPQGPLKIGPKEHSLRPHIAEIILNHFKVLHSVLEAKKL